MEEEFNNFLKKVTDISKIVENLSINDKELNAAAMKEAENYLSGTDLKSEMITSEDDLKTITTFNKTIINKTDDELAEGQMSMRAFKREVELDAKKRHLDRKIRMERCNTYKTRGNKAFNKQKYSQALACYNKAIEQIRDNSNLYLNRSLTYMKLKLFNESIKDSETALKLNEDSLRAWLYMSKCYYFLNNEEKSTHCLNEARKRHPKSVADIQAYEDKLIKGCTTP